jgi:hypothetical protein
MLNVILFNIHFNKVAVNVLTVVSVNIGPKCKVNCNCNYPKWAQKEV